MHQCKLVQSVPKETTRGTLDCVCDLMRPVRSGRARLGSVMWLMCTTAPTADRTLGPGSHSYTNTHLHTNKNTHTGSPDGYLCRPAVTTVASGRRENRSDWKVVCSIFTCSAEQPERMMLCEVMTWMDVGNKPQSERTNKCSTKQGKGLSD